MEPAGPQYAREPKLDFKPPPTMYDALVDWPRRLARETPFYQRWFAAAGAQRVQSPRPDREGGGGGSPFRVLDAACGTGRHVELFHSWGLAVEGADASPEMIAHCRARMGDAPTLRWVLRSFEQPVAGGPFDAVLCVGNSLGLVADRAAVGRAIEALVGAVRPGGVLLVHVLNLWALPEGPSQWSKCVRVTPPAGQVDASVSSAPPAEHVLIKGVHRCADQGYIDLISVAVGAGRVAARFEAPGFLGLEAEELSRCAKNAGASEIAFFGSYGEEPYDRLTSPDLIMVARGR
jgi:SAM-dependent methyltransferase